VEREGLTESDEWKLYLDSCRIVNDEDLLISDLISGKDLFISKIPPSNRNEMGNATISRESSLSSCDNIIWSENSQTETSADENSQTDVSADSSIDGSSGKLLDN
jgi:hypothetical protein